MRASAVLLAIVVNLLLFLMMDRMVAARGLTPVEAFGALTLDVVTLPEISKSRDRAPETPEPEVHTEPTLAPPELRVAMLRTTPLPALVVPAPPELKLAIVGGLSLGDLSIETPTYVTLSPTVRVDPRYPRRALLRKIEGYVDVRFTIQRDGSTSNLSVLESEPPGVFDRSAVEAARQWKFAPRAEPSEDRTRFEFELPSS